MAARKKTEKTEEFVVLYTNCSHDEQLQVLFGGDKECGATVHSTVADAKAEAEQNTADRRIDNDDIPDYAIAQIIHRGKSTGIEWK